MTLTKKDLPELKKITARHVAGMLTGVDKVSVRNGIYTAKLFFFVAKHGMNSTNFAASVMRQLPKTAKMVKRSENWNALPKDSWFEIQFTI